MKFGRVAVAAGQGMILAHSLKLPGGRLRKGEVVDADHVRALEEAGITSFVGARLEPGDIDEDTAALTLAEHIAGAHIGLDRAFTGRCNLLATGPGLVMIDAAAIVAANDVDESITVATLAPFEPVDTGDMVATIKIIPFAVDGARLDAAIRVPKGAVSLAPLLPMRIGVVSTLLPGLKRATVGKTLAILEDRLALARATIAREVRVAHDARQLADAIRAIADVDILVVFGASAITDRRDVVPVAIEMAGGCVEQLGMPVDPGNLLLLGHLARDGVKIPVIGAPGCARSPKVNGFDFVLRRMLANLPVTGRELRQMGVGGLLTEIASRPQPRQAVDG